jgi:hypothetical protein
MSRPCRKTENKRNAYGFLLGKQEEKRPVLTLRCRWVENIKIDL